MSDVQINDVIQLKSDDQWGPLLMIVDKVKAWGVRCYGLVPTGRGQSPGFFYLRVEHGQYERIGRAVFVEVVSPKNMDELEPERTPKPSTPGDGA